MSYFEGNGECHVTEFDRFRNQRLSAADLRLDVIYTLMLAYNFTHRKRTAIKLATTITAMAIAQQGGVDLEFSTLNEHFQPISSFEASFDASGDWRWPDGYTDETDGVVQLEGYFRNHDDGVGIPDLEVLLQKEFAGAVFL